MNNQRVSQGYRSRADVINTIKYGTTAGAVNGRVAADAFEDNTESLFGDATLEFDEQMTQRIRQEKLKAAGLTTATVNPMGNKSRTEPKMTLTLGDPLENCKTIKLRGTTATIGGNETENMSRETFDRMFNIRIKKSKKVVAKEKRKILLTDFLVSLFVFAMAFLICRDFGAGVAVSAGVSVAVLLIMSALVFHTLDKHSEKLITVSMILLVLLTVMGITAAVHSYFLEHTTYLKVFIGTLAILLVSLVGGVEITSGLRALFSKSRTSELDDMFRGRSH